MQGLEEDVFSIIVDREVCEENAEVESHRYGNETEEEGTVPGSGDKPVRGAEG